MCIFYVINNTVCSPFSTFSESRLFLRRKVRLAAPLGPVSALAPRPQPRHPSRSPLQQSPCPLLCHHLLLSAGSSHHGQNSLSIYLIGKHLPFPPPAGLQIPAPVSLLHPLLNPPHSAQLSECVTGSPTALIKVPVPSTRQAPVPLSDSSADSAATRDTTALPPFCLRFPGHQRSLDLFYLKVALSWSPSLVPSLKNKSVSSSVISDPL